MAKKARKSSGTTASSNSNGASSSSTSPHLYVLHHSAHVDPLCAQGIPISFAEQMGTLVGGMRSESVHM